MGLVDDEGIGARQDLTEPLVLEGEIRAQEVMVDHHQIGLLGLAPGLEQVALVPLRAVLPQAIVAGRRDQGPDRRIIRHGQFGDVAVAGRHAPVADPVELGPQVEVPTRVAATLVLQGVCQALAAQVVGATLEQGDACGDTEDLAHQGEVAVKELVLEVARPGGDQDLAP